MAISKEMDRRLMAFAKFAGGMTGTCGVWILAVWGIDAILEGGLASDVKWAFSLGLPLGFIVGYGARRGHEVEEREGDG